jgi:hypothetical protein
MLQHGSFHELRPMPIAPPPAVPPPAPPTPHVVPLNQKVTPVEPSKRVTANKDVERTRKDSKDGKDGEEKRRHDPDDPRGNLYDLEA